MAVHLWDMRRTNGTKPAAWRALQSHAKKMKTVHLRDLFASDPLRAERMTAEGAGLYLDYSKNRITYHTLGLLVDLAERSGLQARIDGMFRGESVNITEARPALHVALRAPKGTAIYVTGDNVVPKVRAVLDRMGHFCNRVRSGELKGHSGKRIRNVVNLGIGGSHLGPSMAVEALKHYSDPALTFRFVANVDGTDLALALRDIDPAETLFIVSSKTFSTLETMTNATTAREWLISGFGGDRESVTAHFVAVSANISRVAQFGIDAAHTFEFWDWVGGRYSLCSAVGLSTMLAIGPKHFASLLDGCHEMDMHYLATPFERNLPVLMGLLSVWYNDLFGAESLAILPYDRYLQSLPAYLQQLMMESNGKHVTLIGTEVTQQTSPICWGGEGTNSQHSFFQLLHQGTRLVPCDFIAFATPLHPFERHHDVLIANMLAQGAALAFGKTAEQVKADGTPDWLVPHRVFDGNRPSNTIMAKQLTPSTLGKLIALYEHSIHTQAVIWNINPFDQWGVELGKELAESILPHLQSVEDPRLEFDSSTSSLVRRYRSLRKDATPCAA
ncbi:MAG TPA: glucose-6-phosphate isomerase [Dongiaceae bacterium]|nr:glucose-6-phosphate isomerase [Dongiaceae bacterium]